MTEEEKEKPGFSLAHPGTNYLAPIEEINRMPKNAIFPTANYPYKTRMKKSVYEKEKVFLQIELAKFQRWVKETGQKFLIIFEGRDAAGNCRFCSNDLRKRRETFAIPSL
jgi:polyphosphate kinase 2 (PPK2 family)